LGPGETSTILLAKELGANPVLLDDYRARKLAKAEGLEILGSVGLLETFYLRHYLTDLRTAFRQLLTRNVYIDQRTVGSSPAIPGPSSSLNRVPQPPVAPAGSPILCVSVYAKSGGRLTSITAQIEAIRHER
jgi:hypothetical protein